MMFKLLEIELRKLVPYRFFWLSVIAYGVLMPALFLSLYKFSLNIRGNEISFELYNFPDVWKNTTYIAGLFNFLLYVFVLQAVTNEYQFKTIRQNIIDGLSPWQYLAGKVMLLLFFALGSTALVGVLSVLSGLFMSAPPHDQSHMFDKVVYLGYYFLQLLGYLSLAMLTGTLVRKAGMAILAFTTYVLIVEAILRYRFLPAEVGPYLPSQALGALVPNPFLGMLGAAVEPGMVAVSCVYILLFILGTGLLIAKLDL